MPPTPLTEEDIVPPELPENTAGIINLLIDAMKLGEYRNRAQFYPDRLQRSALHEIDLLCHRLGVASGTPSWYWLEMIMERPTLQCIDPGCTQPQAQGGPRCESHSF